MPKVTLFYAQSDLLGEFMPKVTLFSFWGKSPFRSTYMWFMPKVTLFYAQSDPLECRGVNLCPKWLSCMPQVTLFRP